MGSNGLKYVTTASLMKYYILVRTVIDFLAHYTQHNAREKIDIYLYLTTHIKISPNDNKIADWINVNTGLTTFCKNETEINIFRAEECFKVFIHECIHNLCLDFGSNGFPLEQLKQTFMVNSEYLLFETYTETWAEIIQILFFNIHNGHNGHNIEIKINDEFTFSAIQCDKIMKICTQNPNASYLDVFNQNKMVLNQYNENSNCFAYYVLKTITLYNINEFLLWCNENNNKILCFNKIDSKKTIRNFIEFIIADTHYKNEAMMKAINHVMLKHKIHKDSFMAKTLRMSIYELVP
jgi:hypothetical protein